MLLGMLPSLASSIYIDPVKNTKRYPQVKVVVETLQETRGEASQGATEQREIMVPLKNYNEHKWVGFDFEGLDPIISGYLDGTYGNAGYYSEEPHLFVTVTGAQDEFRRSKISKVVEMVPPEGAQDVICWLISEKGEKFGYKETPTEDAIAKIECVAFYFNENYVEEYKYWLNGFDEVDEAE